MIKYAKITGFTLIELLIVISIFIIIAVITTPIYSNWNVVAQNNAVLEEIIQTIRQAKIRSQASLNDSAHGIYFTNNQYILYQGNSYDSRDQLYDIINNINNNILSLSTNLTNNEINFSKGLGLPTSTGLVIISNQITERINNISINNLGIVN